jgi:hypothetical protein
MEDAGLGGGRTNGMVEKMHAIRIVSTRRRKTTDLDAMVLGMTLLKYAKCAH